MCKTNDAADRDRGGIYYAATDGILIQRRDCGNHGGGGDSGTVSMAVDRSVSDKIPCNGAVNQVPGGVVHTG